jgi:hypothetical protein
LQICLKTLQHFSHIKKEYLPKLLGKNGFPSTWWEVKGQWRGWGERRETAGKAGHSVVHGRALSVVIITLQLGYNQSEKVRMA